MASANMKNTGNTALWLTLSSICFAVAFIIPSLAWCSFLSLTGLLNFCWQSSPAPASRWLRFFIVLGVFWLSYLGIVQWLHYVTVPGYILLSLYLSLYVAVFSLGCDGLRRSRYRALAAPVLWVLLEYLRSVALGGFGWAFMGYSLFSYPYVIQPADLLGVYGISFMILLGNSAIIEYITRKNKGYLYLWLVLCAAAAGYSYIKIFNGEKDMVLRKSSGISVTVYQPNIPQELKWNEAYTEKIKHQLLHDIASLKTEKADFIVFPESSWPEIVSQIATQTQKSRATAVKHGSIPGNDNPGISALSAPQDSTDMPQSKEKQQSTTDLTRNVSSGDFMTLAGKVPGYLLIGSITQEGNAFYNTAYLFKSGSLKNSYHKMRLVPFGEYVPLRRYLTFISILNTLEDMNAGNEYTMFVLAPNVTFAVLICFEDVFSDLSAIFSRKGAQFLVNITNDAWFGNSAEPAQHLAASVFRAIENKKWVVRAANTGISGFIDPYGKKTLVNNGSLFTKGSLTQTIYPLTEKTWYTRHEKYLGFCWLIFLAILVLLDTRRVGAIESEYK